MSKTSLGDYGLMLLTNKGPDAVVSAYVPGWSRTRKVFEKNGTGRSLAYMGGNIYLAANKWTNCITTDQEINTRSRILTTHRNTVVGSYCLLLIDAISGHRVGKLSKKPLDIAGVQTEKYDGLVYVVATSGSFVDAADFQESRAAPLQYWRPVQKRSAPVAMMYTPFSETGFGRSRRIGEFHALPRFAKSDESVHYVVRHRREDGTNDMHIHDVFDLEHTKVGEFVGTPKSLTATSQAVILSASIAKLGVVDLTSHDTSWISIPETSNIVSMVAVPLDVLKGHVWK